MATWQLQQAKNQLSALIDSAQSEGPQVITRNGVETAVVISAKAYRKMKTQKTSLVEFFQNSPLAGIDFGASRSKDKNRNVDF